MSKKRRSILTGRLIAVLAVMLFLPGMLNAGDLNPPGAPAPTMKTLDQIPPTWSHKLPASERFVLVLDGEAVLDKETGLVWEKTPVSTSYNWSAAKITCSQLSKGGRKGWRLPTLEQLLSLVDPTVPSSSVSLPTGHPFGNVAMLFYWSSTTTDNPSYAWAVDFGGGGGLGTGDKATTALRWCVRGGQSHDAY